MNHRERRPVEKIAKDVIKIITESKATFFGVKNIDSIPREDLLYELKAEICTNVEMYFYKLIKER